MKLAEKVGYDGLLAKVKGLYTNLSMGPNSPSITKKALPKALIATATGFKFKS